MELVTTCLLVRGVCQGTEQLLLQFGCFGRGDGQVTFLHLKRRDECMMRRDWKSQLIRLQFEGKPQTHLQRELA